MLSYNEIDLLLSGVNIVVFIYLSWKVYIYTYKNDNWHKEFAKKNSQPNLTFKRDGDNYRLSNIGNGSAINVIVTKEDLLTGNGNEVTKLQIAGVNNKYLFFNAYHLISQESILLKYEREGLLFNTSNSNRLTVRYTDIEGNNYYSHMENDHTILFSSKEELMQRQNKSVYNMDIEHIWNISQYDPRKDNDKLKVRIINL